MQGVPPRLMSKINTILDSDLTTIEKVFKIKSSSLILTDKMVGEFFNKPASWVRTNVNNYYKRK